MGVGWWWGGGENRIKNEFTTCLKNGNNLNLKQDIEKSFSEMNSTINFASEWMCFESLTKLMKIAIFSQAFHLNFFFKY